MMPVDLALFAVWGIFLGYAVVRWVRTWRTPDPDDERWARYVRRRYPESDDRFHGRDIGEQ